MLTRQQVYDNNIEMLALQFAKEKHEGQVRKYTHDPYIWHPLAVAAKLRSYGFRGNIIAAALLHDVVEDTDTTISDIRQHFNADVTKLVFEVSDISVSADGNRATRKKIDAEHAGRASADGQNIKLADIIDNVKDIFTHDKDFAKIYVLEKENMLAYLKHKDTNKALKREAWEVINDVKKKLEI